jgi:hypothetical protein
MSEAVNGRSPPRKTGTMDSEGTTKSWNTNVWTSSTAITAYAKTSTHSRVLPTRPFPLAFRFFFSSAGSRASSALMTPNVTSTGFRPITVWSAMPAAVQASVSA